MPRDFFSGINLSSDVLSAVSGMIYAVTGLKARGVRQNAKCRKSKACKKCKHTKSSSSNSDQLIVDNGSRKIKIQQESISIKF